MSKVKFTEMKNGSKNDYLLLDKYEQEYINGTADRIIKFMSGAINLITQVIWIKQWMCTVRP